MDRRDEDPEPTAAEGVRKGEIAVNDGNPRVDSRASVAKALPFKNPGLVPDELVLRDEMFRASNPTIDLSNMGHLDGLYDPEQDYGGSPAIGVDNENSEPQTLKDPLTPSARSPTISSQYSIPERDEEEAIEAISNGPSNTSSSSSTNSLRPSKVRFCRKGGKATDSENVPPPSTPILPSASFSVRRVVRHDYSDSQASSSKVAVSHQSSGRGGEVSSSQPEAGEKASLSVSSAATKSVLSALSVNTLSHIEEGHPVRQVPSTSDAESEPTERERSATPLVTPGASKEEDALSESNEPNQDAGSDVEEESQASVAAPDIVLTCNWQGSCEHEIKYSHNVKGCIMVVNKHLREAHLGPRRRKTAQGGGQQGDNNRGANQVANVQATSGRFHCGFVGCDQSFKQPRDLARHYFHKHFDITVVCHNCGDTFSRPDSLERHEKEQEGRVCEERKARKEEAAKNGGQVPRRSRAKKRPAEDDDSEECVPSPPPKRQRARR